MGIRKPGIQKEVDFSGCYRGEDRGDVGILQCHLVALLLQNRLGQITHGDAFRPVHVADGNFFRVFGTVAADQEHQDSQQQDQVDKYK